MIPKFLATAVTRLKTRPTSNSGSNMSLPSDFDPTLYLDIHADVAMAVEAGRMASAEAHYEAFGLKENRIYRFNPAIAANTAPNNSYRYPYRTYGTLPSFKFSRPSSSPEDALIGERIIKAWKHVELSKHADTTGMWAGRMDSFPSLQRAIAGGDGAAVAKVLSNMFQSHIAHGLAMGRATGAFARQFPRQMAAAWTDRLIRISEAVGAAPVRSAEQGDYAAVLETNVTIAQVEKHLGFSLEFPDVGAPYGVFAARGILPEHAFSMAYAAWRIMQATKSKRIAEIGGGFGGLCWYMRHAKANYTIFDLPFTCVLQSYFLIKAGLDVSLYGEADASVRILPWWEINNEQSFDLVINQDSIPEMPAQAGEAYIKRIKEIAPLFYSINQEAAALNTSDFNQLIVSELVNIAGGYRRQHRNIFWLRDGYVEELYSRMA